MKGFNCLNYQYRDQGETMVKLYGPVLKLTQQNMGMATRVTHGSDKQQY